MEVDLIKTKSLTSYTLIRTYRLHLFFSGDYEFLSTCYGLSGASGMFTSTTFLIINDTLKL